MIGETSLKQSYINQILAKFNDKNSDFSSIARQLNIYNIESDEEKQNFLNLSLIEKLKKLKEKLQEIDYGELLNISMGLDRSSSKNRAASTNFYHETNKDFSEFGFFGIISGMFKFIFNPHKGGFLHSLMSIVDNLSISLNPEVNLLIKEKQLSAHSDLFVEAAKIDPKFNRIYRGMISEGCSEQQILHHFFKLLKTNSVTLSNTQKHRLFELAEQKLLMGSNTLCIAANDINSKITENLTKVARIFDIESLHSGYCEPGSSTCKHQINLISNAVGSLIKKISDQEKTLRNYMNATDDNKKSKEEKLALYSHIQHNKSKLYHFLLKTEAWVKGETLSKYKPFDFTYIYKQFQKFPVKPVESASSTDAEGVASPVDNKSIFKLFTGTNSEYQDIILNNQANFDGMVQYAVKQDLLQDVEVLEQDIKEFRLLLELQKKHFETERACIEERLNRVGGSNFPEFGQILLKMSELLAKIQMISHVEEKLDSLEIQETSDGSKVKIKEVINILKNKITAIDNSVNKDLFQDGDDTIKNYKHAKTMMVAHLKQYKQYLYRSNILKENVDLDNGATEFGAQSRTANSFARIPRPRQV